MNIRSKKKAVLLVVCLLAVIVIAAGGFRLAEKMLDGTETRQTMADSQSQDGVGRTYYQGVWYEPNDSVETVLVLGIDRFMDGTGGREDSQQSDFLALLVLDHAAETFQLVQLNRDTMTDIPLRDITGVEYTTRYAQLALAHVYGGKEESSRCRNAVSAVRNLFYGAPIDHYLSLTMDAVATLNDAVGGVTVHIEEDMTAVDAAFTQGADVTLIGTQALSFVRARGGLEDSTNVSRMARQRQYLSALFEKFTTESIKSTEVYLQLNDTMTSDLTLDQLTSLEKWLKTYSYTGIRTLDGESVKGEEYMEFYVNEDALQEMIIELFYIAAD